MSLFIFYIYFFNLEKKKVQHNAHHTKLGQTFIYLKGLFSQQWSKIKSNKKQKSVVWNTKEDILQIYMWFCLSI